MTNKNKMYSRLGKRIAAVIVMASLCYGCSNENQMETTLQALERGKARGQLIFTTDGRMSVSQSIDFGIGTGGSTLSFSGAIDFSGNRQTVE